MTLEFLGGKGINLVELTNAGFRVPPGFVVTTGAYKRFVEANGLQKRILELAARTASGQAGDFEEVSAEIRKLPRNVRWIVVHRKARFMAEIANFGEVLEVVRSGALAIQKGTEVLES